MDILQELGGFIYYSNLLFFRKLAENFWEVKLEESNNVLFMNVDNPQGGNIAQEDNPQGGNNAQGGNNPQNNNYLSCTLYDLGMANAQNERLGVDSGTDSKFSRF